VNVDVAHLIVYLLVALVAGLIAERLVGASLPGGYLGSVLAALIGIFLMVDVLHFAVPGDPNLGGVPIFTAILGAALVVVLWVLMARAMPRRAH
jgi:uncharacterized membrane protein YeaQ/YmgE (transglycosylase-associated protein family)